MARQVLDYAHAHKSAMLADLERYVVMDSGSGDAEGIRRAAELFAAALMPLGFTASEVQGATARHVVARRAGDARRVLAIVHLDTVWPKGTLAEFPFHVEGDHVSGPGVADMKGGWVILQWAVQSLVAIGVPIPSIEVFMTADEELGSRTARRHIEEAARSSDCALVMEPARESGALVTSRGAVGAFMLKTFGRTAHSITGRRGASAIDALARKIIDLEKLTERNQQVVVNVGVIGGGTARQVVPEQAWASVDLRAPTTKLAEQAAAAIRRIAERSDLEATSAELSGGVTRPAFERGAGTAMLFNLASDCARAIGLQLGEETTGAGSDGNFTSDVGTPTLDGLGAHGFNVCSKDEYIIAESLPERAALVAGLLAAVPPVRSG